MSDITRMMQAAADEPNEPFDVETAWRRGRRLRVRRAILVSVAASTIVVGAGFAFTQTVPEKATSAPAEPAGEPSVGEESECEDRTVAYKDVVAHCIARGTYDGSSWFYGAFIEDGELCIQLNEPGGGGGTGCGEAKNARTVSPGLSSGGPGGPILTATVPEQSVTVVVETQRGATVEAPIYDAPEEIGLSLRFVLLFDLPKGSERVIAYDASGAETARGSLDLLLETSRQVEEELNAEGGWMIANDAIAGETWDLSADLRQDGSLQCVMLGLGNDVEAADVKIAATSCYASSETDGLELEQMWWEGLEAHAPVFGLVGSEVDKVEMRLDGAEPLDIEIRRGPTEGLWRDQPVFDVDFIVAFPPLGATGEIVALDRSGKLLEAWPLCMSERSEEGYGSCNQATEFWQPGAKD